MGVAYWNYTHHIRSELHNVFCGLLFGGIRAGGTVARGTGAGHGTRPPGP